MDPTDKELKEGLASGPFARSGFDDRLRRRIEDSLERPRKKFGRTTRFGWSFASAAVLMVAVVGFGAWQLSSSGGLSGKEAHSELRASDTQLAAADSQNDVLRTALLLGLRKDVTAPDGRIVSSYRTVLVAPDNNKLQIAAEGTGIVMPYHQTFWKIETAADDGTTESQHLIAYQAYGKKAVTETPKTVNIASRPGLMSERLLYVGNQYVSIAQESADAGEADREYRFVKEIKQVAAAAGTDYDPATELHTVMESASLDIAQATQPADGTQQWAVVRKPGRWTGVTYASSGTLAPIDMNTEKESSVELPETVAPRDELLLGWNDIRRLVPAATDAYTYADLLAVTTDREVTVIPYKMKNGASRAVTVELDPEESIIMVEWALNQSDTKNYADQWKSKVAEILAKPGVFDQAKS